MGCKGGKGIKEVKVHYTGSAFTYSDIADRTDLRLKMTKHGERAVLTSSPQSQWWVRQDQDWYLGFIKSNKKKKDETDKKAAKFSFMYLVSSKKAFASNLEKCVERNSGWRIHQTYFLEVLQPRSKNEKKIV